MQLSTEEQVARHLAKSPEEQERIRIARKARRAARKKGRAEKKTAKWNKRLEHIRAETLRRMQKCSNTVVCVDLEMWERKQSKLTEIGLTTFDRTTNKIKTVHFVIEENLNKRNGRFVDDNKDNFLHGDSEIVSEEEALRRTKEIIDQHEVVVGHGVGGDLKYLRRRGLHFRHDLRVLDTMLMYQAYAGKTQPRNLGKICALYGMTHQAPHNAANDSHINMYLFAYLFKRLESWYLEPTKLAVVAQ